MRSLVSLLLLTCLSPGFSKDSGFSPVRLVQAQGDVTLTTLKGDASGSSFPWEMILEEGDLIKTGRGSNAEISLDRATLIRLEEESALRLTRLSTHVTFLNLRYGVLLAKVKFGKKEGEQFYVKTPVALATVRGTEFVIEQRGRRARIGVLDEGHVAVTAPGTKKTVVMHFNQETQVQKGRSPEDAKMLEGLYSYKNPMAAMRQRIKVIRKNANALTPSQRSQERAAWIKTHRPRKRRSSR